MSASDAFRFRPARGRQGVYFNDGLGIVWVQQEKGAAPDPVLTEAIRAGLKAFWRVYHPEQSKSGAAQPQG